MNHIVNTEKNGVDLSWLLGGNPGAIAQQEQEGQMQLVQSSCLPIESCNNAHEKLTALGVVFKKAVVDDPLFIEVDLPEGWQLQPTEHNMWSQLVDETGSVRAKIFYKASFYDRAAFINFVE